MVSHRWCYLSPFGARSVQKGALGSTIPPFRLEMVSQEVVDNHLRDCCASLSKPEGYKSEDEADNRHLDDLQGMPVARSGTAPWD
mmetsp:Transcript_48358/g.81382  ORF Transcript_48358/g.81382 Transcript_48358/m.81382 type:complete len:85 (+) Transcript_48358:12-266(+)